jgi:GT2 family glycosyltransferase
VHILLTSSSTIDRLGRKKLQKDGMNREVAIVVLNWNNSQDTIECLESLTVMDYQNYVTIVVDNGSSDESIENFREFAKGNLKIESKFFPECEARRPIKIIEYDRDQIDRKDKIEKAAINGDKYENEQLILIRNECNYGFAEGNNIGIQFALDVVKPNYVLLLNSDTVVDRDFLSELVRVSVSVSRIGVVGPKVYYYHNPFQINAAGARMHYWSGFAVNIGIGQMDDNQFNEIQEVDCVHGSAMLIKASALEDLGLLDPDFFVLLEETEWCLRAKKAGYKIFFVPTARVYHKEGFSATRRCKFYYYSNRNRILLLKKHQKSLRKAVYGVSITLRTLAASIILSVKAEPTLAMCTLNGFFNGLRIKK